MTIILMSIQSKYARKIFRGEKKWEYRKALPRGHSPLSPLRVLVYSAGDDKSVVGEFVSADVLQTSFPDLMKKTGCDSDQDAVAWLSEYYRGKTNCGAMKVGHRRGYRKPVTLSVLRSLDPDFRAPQNFIYLSEKHPIVGFIDSQT